MSKQYSLNLLLKKLAMSALLLFAMGTGPLWAQPLCQNIKNECLDAIERTKPHVLPSYSSDDEAKYYKEKKEYDDKINKVCSRFTTDVAKKDCQFEMNNRQGVDPKEVCTKATDMFQRSGGCKATEINLKD